MVSSFAHMGARGKGNAQFPVAKLAHDETPTAAEAKAAFDVFDTDKSGGIDRDEFKAVLMRPTGWMRSTGWMRVVRRRGVEWASDESRAGPRVFTKSAHGVRRVR